MPTRKTTRRKPSTAKRRPNYAAKPRASRPNGRKATPTDKLNIDAIASMFRLPEWSDFEERNQDNIREHGSYAYRSALDDGKRESAAEKARDKAERQARDDYYHAWYDGVMGAAEEAFEVHGLELVPAPGRRKSPRPYSYKVEPRTSWRDAAEQIIETINGVGMFHFSGVADLRRSGPYKSDREAVLVHLGHIPSAAEVYGNPRADRIFDRIVSSKLR